jgi:hypothetical protein
MDELRDIQFLGKNFKSIGQSEVGFDQILPINILIGRNNSGKSALIDMLESVFLNNDVSPFAHKTNGQTAMPSIRLTRTLVFDNDNLKLFPRLPRRRHNAKQFIGEKLVLGSGGTKILGEFRAIRERGSEFSDSEWSILGGVDAENRELRENPIRDKVFRRISADRDVTKETENLIQRADSGSPIKPNGNGCTNLIGAYLTYENWPHELVETVLLNSLNEIVYPDMKFERIAVYKSEGDGQREIFLQEKDKGMISLAQSGSGLKTIILVLAHLHLVPNRANKPLADFIFGFEELENNLHPAMQRRLFLYLRKIALEKGCTFFLTTHSNIPIDIFNADPHAQILHVTHDGESTKVTKASGYVQKRDILDDLGLRASDLLQANAVVWVEGPSDRIYFNRWIEVWTNGELVEGTHYHCMLYGGRLLSHFSGDDPETAPEDLINLLRINRNALLIADSDCKNSKESPNATKQRLAAEIDSIGGKSWITAGKEIENYIPIEALRAYHQKPDLPELNRYHLFPNYLDDKVEKGLGRRFEKHKPLYAREIIPFFTKENLSTVPGLGEHMVIFVALLRKWNGID